MLQNVQAYRSLPLEHWHSGFAFFSGLGRTALCPSSFYLVYVQTSCDGPARYLPPAFLQNVCKQYTEPGRREPIMKHIKILAHLTRFRETRDNQAHASHSSCLRTYISVWRRQTYRRFVTVVIKACYCEPVQSSSRHTNYHSTFYNVAYDSVFLLNLRNWTKNRPRLYLWNSAWLSVFYLLHVSPLLAHYQGISSNTEGAVHTVTFLHTSINQFCIHKCGNMKK